MLEKPAVQFSLAPMMARTTPPFRYLARLLSPTLLLYTEMITAEALIFGDQQRLLMADSREEQLILQIGCSAADQAAKAVAIAEQYPYFSGYNLNVGCPSDRVQHSAIGAVLMAEPARVADILIAMRSATTKPVSIKQRIGIQSSKFAYDSYEDLLNFTSKIAPLVDWCTIHARVAILEGLSPQENREVPPLLYHYLQQLQLDLPELTIEINGGINSFAAIEHHRSNFRCIMLGRWPWNNNWILAQLEQRYNPCPPPPPSRRSILLAYLDWLDRQPLHCYSRYHWLKPLHNICHARPHGRLWRRLLSSPAATGDPRQIISTAMQSIPAGVLAEAAL